MSSKTINILALHGFTGSGEDFNEFSPFCDPCLRWYCPDLPGHGDANTLSATPEATTSYLKTQANALSPTAPKVLLGYSMGARAALLFAIEHPEINWDAIILISGSPGIKSAEAKEKRHQSDLQLSQSIENQGLKIFFEYWDHLPIISTRKNTPPAMLERLHSYRRKHSSDGLARSLREFGQGAYPDLRSKLHELRMPTLWITGEYDSKYTAIARNAVTHTSNAENTIITNCGHMPHQEQSATTALAINRFLKIHVSRHSL